MAVEPSNYIAEMFRFPNAMVVKLWSTTRHLLSRLSLAFLGLGLAVFAWGIQYKLSLYDPPQSVTHRIPEAKLLSKDEKTRTPENRSVKQMEPGVLIPLLCSLFLLFQQILDAKIDPAWKYHERERKRPWRIFNCAHLDAFFFRPPPALLA
jgi:hypothetical protein